MTPNPYNEDHLVEQPALALLAELGWQPTSGLEETFAEAGGSLGRRSPSEVVVLPRLRAALERPNPDQPAEAIAAAIEELSRNRSSMALVSANRELYGLLKDGVLVSVADPERGGQRKERLRVIEARLQREINHWSHRYEELKLLEQAGKQVRLPARVAKERAEVLVSRLVEKAPDVEVKVQEDFIMTGDETLEMLDRYIHGCDGVIHSPMGPA